MNFDQAVEYLLQLGHETLAMKLGLRNTELLLEALGNPERAYVCVQIAGTNGKGSTAVVLDSICRKAGIKTGLYTSPHLVTITERIKINGNDLAKDVFARHATTVRTVAEKLVGEGKIEALPTFFEQVTAIAFWAFKEAGIQVGILETGLGGRLDSTSAARADIVAITQIALDHEEYLGNTLASIAAEKAAIIRQGVKAVVVANNQPPEALAVIEQKCRETDVIPKNDANAQIRDVTVDGTFCVTFETGAATYESLWLGLRGEHQIANVAVAIQLAESLIDEGFDISAIAIRDGVRTASHPGRLELIPSTPPFLLDGAHNPAATRILSNHLRRFAQRPLTTVFGAMRDKQTEEMIDILAEISDTLVFTKPQNVRAADPQELSSRNTAGGASKMRVALTSGDAIAAALESTPPHGLILVTGSLYLVGEIRDRLTSGSRGTSNKA